MAATLAQLRARARVLADMTNTQFLTDAEFNDLVNDGIDALWADVTSVNKDFRNKVFPFNITSTATNFIVLSSVVTDFREVRYVRRDPGTTNQKILNKLGMRSGSMQAEQSYRLQDANLYIEPFLNSVAAYDLIYIPQSPRLAADGSVLDLELDQFAEYVILHATIKALGKEESDAQAATFLALFDPNGDGKKGERGKVMRWASDQRSADPDQVEDVRGSRRSRTNWPAF